MPSISLSVPKRDKMMYVCIYNIYKYIWKWKWSHVWLFATPWTVAYQAPLSMRFSRQGYWSGLPFSSPGDLPNPGIELVFPALQADALPSEPPGSPIYMCVCVCVCVCIHIHTHIYMYIYIFTIVQKNTWIPFKILKFYFSFFLKENNQLFFTSFSVGCLHWFFHHIYSFLNYQLEKGKGEAKGKIPQQLIALVAQSCLILTPHGL